MLGCWLGRWLFCGIIDCFVIMVCLINNLWKCISSRYYLAFIFAFKLYLPIAACHHQDTTYYSYWLLVLHQFYKLAFYTPDCRIGLSNKIILRTTTHLTSTATTIQRSRSFNPFYPDYDFSRSSTFYLVYD